MFYLSWCRHTLAVILLVITFSTTAGVIIGGTRIVVTDSLTGTSLQLSNPENSSVFLIESYITPYRRGTHDEMTGNGTIPFIVTPPVFRIDPGQQNVVRILYTGGLPEDRESLFSFHAKAIPQLKKNRGNTVAFAFDSALKLFYRPQILTGPAARQAYTALTFHRQKNQLIVTNPTPYHISLYELRAGEEKIDIKKQPMLMPQSSASYLLPVSTKNTIQWKTIDDFGAITQEERATL